MAAGVDDEAVKAARSQILAKYKQRRHIKIHRYAMDEEQSKIEWSCRRSEKRPCKRSLSEVLNVQSCV